MTPQSIPTEMLDSAKPKTKRIIELDALRAIAALNLLLFHFTWVYSEKYGFASPLGFTLPYGKYGVELFFILSGFVNAMTLLRKRNPADFVAGRFIRILPSYWLVILLNIVLFSTLPMFGETVTKETTLANMTVVPGLLGYENMEPVTWTLQIEMLFYGMLLIFLLTGLIDKVLPTMMIGITVSLFGCLGTQYLGHYYPDWSGTEWTTFFSQLFILPYLPLFAMGMLLNEIKSKRGKLWMNITGILISAVIFHVIDLRDHNPAATALLFGLVAFSAYGKIPILRCKPFVFISAISYSLYLFHNNLGSALMKLLEHWTVSPLGAVILATLFSIAISAAITFWLEQPVTKYLRGRWSDLKAWHANQQHVKRKVATPVPVEIDGQRSRRNNSNK